jgi:hypothetical protein
MRNSDVYIDTPCFDNIHFGDLFLDHVCLADGTCDRTRRFSKNRFSAAETVFQTNIYFLQPPLFLFSSDDSTVMFIIIKTDEFFIVLFKDPTYYLF